MDTTSPVAILSQTHQDQVCMDTLRHRQQQAYLALMQELPQTKRDVEVVITKVYPGSSYVTPTFIDSNLVGKKLRMRHQQISLSAAVAFR